MRIAHVTDGYLPRLGGIETQVHDLARAHLAAGHDAEIITATPGPRDDGPVVHRPSRDRDHPSAGAVIATATDRALDGGYDVLHVHLSIASPLATSVLWRAARARRPVVATMHSLWGPAEPALTVARRLLGDRAHAVRWTAVSSAAATPLRCRLGVPVAVVPNGVDVNWWAAARRRCEPESLRALSVMRLSGRKRPVPLVRMLGDAARAARSSSPVGLTLVGDGRLAARTAHRAARDELVDLSLTGRLDRGEIRQLTAEHTLYLAPAPLESFGLAALEARSAGLPVVAFRHSGVADFVRDGWDGVLVDDDDGLTAAVAALIRAPEDLRRLRTNARRHRPRLGWPVTLAGYERSYDHAVGRRTTVLA